MFKEIIKLLGLVKDFSDAKECYGKRWFTSKVLWANVLAVGALLLQNHVGFILSAEDQVAVLAVLNIVLRFFTVQPVVSTEDKIVCSQKPTDNPSGMSPE